MGAVGPRTPSRGRDAPAVPPLRVSAGAGPARQLCGICGSRAYIGPAVTKPQPAGPQRRYSLLTLVARIGTVESMRTEAQVIEIFHLLFLRVLGGAGRNDWFVLKGGANLRYFFASPRYSNDIDLDFSGRKSWQLAKTVESVLSGRAMSTLAAASGIELAEVSLAKQTETTLRWKVGLAAEGHRNLVRTKVEFSGRGTHDGGAEFEVVPDAIVMPYALQAPTVFHYLETPAIDQKIAALALRSETKARDVFDLELLFRQRAARGDGLTGLDATHASAAAERTLQIRYSNFTTEVAPFLDAELAELYGPPEWDDMCLKVHTALEQVAAGSEPTEGAS